MEFIISKATKFMSILLIGLREETATKLSKRINGFFSELVDECCSGVPDIILELRIKAF
jgi:hypothetical protein